jgi:hypothetical protein
MTAAINSARTRAPLAVSGATKLMRSLCLPYIKNKSLLRANQWRAAGIPDDICNQLSQNACAAWRLGSDKADAVTLSSLHHKQISTQS